MRESQRWAVSGVLGWLVVAVPAAALLFLVASYSVYRFGVSGGLAYSAALVAWVVGLVWRAKRLNG